MTAILIIDTDAMRFIGKASDEATAKIITDGTDYNDHWVAEESDLNTFKTGELVKLYNGIMTDKPVNKFADKATAMKRTWAALEGAKPKVTKAIVSTSSRGTGRYPHSSIIRVQTAENPRRATSHGGKHWLLYRDGMTITELMQAYEEERDEEHAFSGGLNHFYWDIAKGFIGIVEPSGNTISHTTPQEK